MSIQDTVETPIETIEPVKSPKVKRRANTKVVKPKVDYLERSLTDNLNHLKELTTSLPDDVDYEEAGTKRRSMIEIIHKLCVCLKAQTMTHKSQLPKLKDFNSAKTKDPALEPMCPHPVKSPEPSDSEPESVSSDDDMPPNPIALVREETLSLVDDPTFVPPTTTKRPRKSAK